MKALRRFFLRLSASIARGQDETRLNDEIEQHLVLQTAENIRAGMTPEEARRQAVLKFGSVEGVTEEYRDQRRLPLLETLGQDARYALRGLRRSPGFAAVAVLTLALGIGANTAIFSFVNSLILQPLPYPEPEQLMHFSTQFPGAGLTRFWLSAPEYLEFRNITRSFSVVGAYTTAEVNVSAGDRAMRARSAAVDEHLLAALGVQPAQGRLFAPGETDAVGAPSGPGLPSLQPPPIVLLSHELWQTAFGGRPVIGQMIEVHGRRREIIGIMPPGADVADNRTEIWLPLGMTQENRRNQGNHFLYAIGRLRDGASIESAQSELNAFMESWQDRVGAPGHGFFPLGHESAHILQMIPLQRDIVGAANHAVWVLQAAVGFILLIACGNLANLLLARAETRRREFAVRAALGASRGHLWRQFLVESMLISIAGGTCGLALAHLGVQFLVRTYPNSLPRTNEVSVDARVLFFALVLSIGTGVFCALVALMHTRLKGLAVALKEGSTRGTTASRHYMRRALVVAQVALAIMIVVGAGLLLRTVSNLTTVDAGFDRSRLVTFLTTLPNFRYPDPASRAELYRRLVERLRTIPGVQAASAMSGLPLNRPINAFDLQFEGGAGLLGERSRPIEYTQAVMSDYFETMRIPMVQGRAFQFGDAATPGLVAIVNETLAATAWPDQNPIGRRVRRGDSWPWFTVIGEDVKQGGVDQPTRNEFYFLVEETGTIRANWLFGTGAPGTMNLVLRTALPPAALSATIERIVREVDPAIPVVRLREMEDAFAESIRQPRLLAQLLAAFASLALLLAAIGIYGVLSYMVAERRREIGIRMALGAGRTRVLAKTLKQGFALTIVGTVAGIAGALGLNQLIASLLFGVQPTDTGTFAMVIVTILLVAAVACGLPAWRAARVDPLIALRYE